MFHIRLCCQGMSSLRQSTSISVMRPPKPPSWRDFVASDVSNKPPQSSPAVASSNDNQHTTSNLPCRILETKSATHLHNIHELPRPSITSLSSAGLANRSTKLGGRNRQRAKIHRTRSEHGILTDELPRDSLPPILKVTSMASKTSADIVHPSTSNPDPNSSNVYPVSLEINRRCQSWLASIEACEPLDEVSYSASTPIPSPVAAAVAEEKKLSYKNDFGAFPDPGSDYGEQVDVEIPDEMFVWRGERRSNSPLSQEETFPPINYASHTAASIGNRSGIKVTKYSIASSGSYKDAFIPIEKQFLPSDKSKQRVEFTNFHNDEDLGESLKKNNKKNSSKLCCDMCITFNCYRRKDLGSDS